MKLSDRAGRFFGSGFGFEGTDDLEEWASSPSRNLEAGFAVARALLVLSVFLLAGAGPNRIALSVPSPLVAIYSLYAAALILVSATSQKRPGPLVFVVTHIADILWSCVFAASVHSSGALWLLFIFPMMTATYRWGPLATLGTTLVLVAGLAGLTDVGTIAAGAAHSVSFEMTASIILLGASFALLGQTCKTLANIARQHTPTLMSGSPSQIIQSAMEQAFEVFRPKHIQILVDEAAGRTFLWHAEMRGGTKLIVHSEEFDQASADRYLQLMPESDWFLSRTGRGESLLTVAKEGPARVQKSKVSAQFSGYFDVYTNVVSATLRLGDDWSGRIIICDPGIHESGRKTLEKLRSFCREVAPSIHTAQLCLRSSRSATAEEGSRLGRELHDGVIQSLMGVELRLERLRLKTDASAEMRAEVSELQNILRNEAVGLRKLVADSRGRALSPERLIEYVSHILERFQRDSGFVTHFFADLSDEPMPPRVCHEIVRITEEAITNARKHSRGSTLTLRIGCAVDSWLVVIIDDGVGFGFKGTWSLEKLQSAGLGPRVIKERVQSLGGSLLIESSPGGARIEINIPMNNNSRRLLFPQSESMQLQA